MERATGDGLWAITAYWNPMRYGRRRDNYRLFRDRLGLPLLAVELSNDGAFDLSAGDADVLVQRRGPDVIWQKERLLNLALAEVPRDCGKVVWVDCDVVFASVGWPAAVASALDRYALVQPFSAVRRMPANWQQGDAAPDDAEARRAVPAIIASGVTPAATLGRPAEQVGCAFGYAWAGRRDLLTAHGLYDACIVGGGDSALVRAAYGRIDDAIRLHLMNAARAEHYRAWAGPFHASVGGRVGFVEGELRHLWHGSTENRRYRQRLEDFSRFDFDPAADIAIDDGGAWRWSSDKPEMHRFVADYFASRMEDG